MLRLVGSSSLHVNSPCPHAWFHMPSTYWHSQVWTSFGTFAHYFFLVIFSIRCILRRDVGTLPWLSKEIKRLNIFYKITLKVSDICTNEQLLREDLCWLTRIFRLLLGSANYISVPGFRLPQHKWSSYDLAGRVVSWVACIFKTNSRAVKPSWALGYMIKLNAKTFLPNLYALQSHETRRPTRPCKLHPSHVFFSNFATWLVSFLCTFFCCFQILLCRHQWIQGAEQEVPKNPRALKTILPNGRHSQGQFLWLLKKKSGHRVNFFLITYSVFCHAQKPYILLSSCISIFSQSPKILFTVSKTLTAEKRGF